MFTGGRAYNVNGIRSSEKLLRKFFVMHMRYVYCGVGPKLTMHLDRLKTSSEQYLY
jgi:hypothetical protein